ncbi:MAG: hypothetical protein PHE58_07505 [Candidatus Omnitrophica bacterium]|nr:hypothetical protein [Candidatus Omnitrophota bacterium]
MGRKTISATVVIKVLRFTKHTISGYRLYDFFGGVISPVEDSFSACLLYIPFLYSKTNPNNIYKDTIKSRQDFSMAAEVLYSRLYSRGIKNNT